MAADLQAIADQINTDSVFWFGDKALTKDLGVCALGLGGETGEVMDLIKKFLRGSLDKDEFLNLVSVELIDVMHYWLGMCYMLGVDIATVYEHKRAENVKRWGDPDA